MLILVFLSFKCISKICKNLRLFVEIVVNELTHILRNDIINYKVRNFDIILNVEGENMKLKVVKITIFDRQSENF